MVFKLGQVYEVCVLIPPDFLASIKPYKKTARWKMSGNLQNLSFAMQRTSSASYLTPLWKKKYRVSIFDDLGLIGYA